jgi:hypothetical protein
MAFGNDEIKKDQFEKTDTLKLLSETYTPNMSLSIDLDVAALLRDLSAPI